MSDASSEAEAACGLGVPADVRLRYGAAVPGWLVPGLAGELATPAKQGRAHGNLSLAYESLGNFEQAVTHGEQHLSIAAQMNDKVYGDGLNLKGGCNINSVSGALTCSDRFQYSIVSEQLCNDSIHR